MSTLELLLDLTQVSVFGSVTDLLTANSAATITLGLFSSVVSSTQRGPVTFPLNLLLHST